MTTYTVQDIISRDEKPMKKGGTFTQYALYLLNVDGEVGLADFGNLNPSPGDTIEGYEIRDEGFGPELKKEGTPPRPKASPRAGKDFKADPVKLRDENRRSALHCAAGVAPDGTSSQDILKVAQKFYEWIVADD